ncbi:PRTRC system protein B [Acidithiobacillus sp.]|jgi:PRTRC genetic system protein B|uniref:PRTRC system protein B n=1 Tax=Acidithiobacillus sp. TaxID=1872118 RepID=UPI002639DE43|nr:PRTRC system protein B [Acidithiobacillus sp.]MDD5278690.1 PRTRC system protein B [Acidithiobacillus sp.]
MDIRVELGSGTAQWSLQAAFLLYANGKGIPDANAFVTFNKIRQTENGTEIGPGKPVSISLLRSLMNNTESSEFIDDKVLYKDSGKIIWWCPRQSARTIFFNTRDEALQGPLKCAHPALVFRLNTKKTNNPLAVCAVKGDARPTPETTMYYAPYFNIWESTVVCHGNADYPPIGAEREQLAAWEEVFFNSAFSHPNYDRVVKGGALNFWRKRIKMKSSRFPESMLVKTPYKLHQWADLKSSH